MQFINWYITPLYIATLLSLLLSSTAGTRFSERRAFIFLSVLWVLAALLRPWGISPDDENYEVHLLLTDSFSQQGFSNTMGFSYFYYLLLSVVREFDDSTMAFLTLSATFLALKMILMAKVTRYSLCALFIYVSIFFRLHDVIQFRVAAASLFYLLAICLFVHGERLKSSASYAVSVLMHSQSAVTPVLVAVEKVFKQKYWLAILFILITQVLAQLNLTLPLQGILGIFVLEDSTRLTTTLESSEGGTGGFRLTSVAIIIFLVLSIKSMQKYGDDYPLVKYAFYSVVTGFFIYWVTDSVATVSNRLLQFMWVPMVFMGPLMKKNRAFYFLGIGVCISFFILQTYISTFDGIE